MDGSDQIYKGDDGSALRFFYEPVRNNFQSEKLGRSIFDNMLYMEVMTPGSSESIPRFEVERTYCEEVGKNPDGSRLTERGPKYEQYEKQVEAFKGKSSDYADSGMPIGQWPGIDAGLAATLKAVGIHTVEMLSQVQDAHLPNLGTGGLSLRERAKAYLLTRQFGMPSAEMANELAALKDRLALLEAENTALRAAPAAQIAPVSLETPAPAPAPAPILETASLDALASALDAPAPAAPRPLI